MNESLPAWAISGYDGHEAPGVSESLGKPSV